LVVGGDGAEGDGIKIGEVCWAVVDIQDEIACGDIGYASEGDARDAAWQADQKWPDYRPHRVARVRLVEVDESGKETA
jgi:hypothetical protein